MNELVLIEFFSICLQFAGSSSLREEVFVAVLELLVWLASPVVEQVAGKGEESADQPESVVALDEASVHGDAATDTSEYQSGVDFPGMDGGGVLHTEGVEGAIARA